MSQRKSDKNLLIETHSDLIVRRLMRSILDESLPQQAIAIYFTDVKSTEDEKVYSSILTPVRIDDRGTIANWPEDFLDEDIFESRRLMWVMYGDKDHPKAE